MDFQFEIIKKPPESSYDKFVIHEKYIDIKDNPHININEVVGTDHCDYNEISWINALKTLKRKDINLLNLKCDNNNTDIYNTLNYYNANIATKKKLGGDDPWSATIYKFNDKSECYINGGNHRTIISKFLYQLGLINNIIPVTRGIIIKKINIEDMEVYDTIIQKFAKQIILNKLSISIINVNTNRIASNIKEFKLFLDVKYFKPSINYKLERYPLELACRKIEKELQLRLTLSERIIEGAKNSWRRINVSST